jgi:hypothetical protein
VAAFFWELDYLGVGTDALEGKSVIRKIEIVLLIAMASTASAQDPASLPTGGPGAEGHRTDVLRSMPWHYGPFVNGGSGVGNRSDFQFLSLGFEAGKVLTPVVHAGILSGQFELADNIMPLWQSYTPAAHLQTFEYQGKTYTQPVGGGTYTGASITPVIFRWNFATKSHRIQPWFQAAGGLIYTTHKFPPDVLVPHGAPGATSVWNFSPQGGAGLHYFLRSKRSIDIGVNAIHISSASLGDHNPGVNASIQAQVGYTWWK